ncbi:PepSY-associated TM helix domain-containing protein [Algibacter miyuki]|uniref:PepSY-associated TM helix domain-containing protein n=1 Tax=Algibacter miyuki TaxID=1306933 RepID=A0ABV5H4C9_9FLAO|nr:PepSY-associated TM helix domain-containing protein [Algibacter miyuki]MDN3663861.1 PepSY-associated TM helix domain-containing protein [Algibacter miyuki]
MSNRIYNIMFHTHAVSGIIISAALYVIFFTGSISFLRDEIIAWERNEPVTDSYFSEVNFDDLLISLEKEHELNNRDISFYQRIEGQMASTVISPPKNVKPQKKRQRRNFFVTNLSSYKTEKYQDSYTLGEFFYRLHFFAQLNLLGQSGYLLAGIVAFFFLFAVITGVIVHWKKIISSFYVFRPNSKWKTIWTDAHVSLGIIGLPFQFMFAVTGAYLIIGYSIMLPPIETFLFNNDTKEFNKALNTEKTMTYDLKGEAFHGAISYNSFIEKTKDKWPNLKINKLEIYNYGDANMHVKVEGHPLFKDKFIGTGHLTFNAINGDVVDEKNPYLKTSYVEGSTDVLKRLHYGDYGGYGMKLIYFVLGLITCFVIISGVLIWLVARDKKNVPEYKRKFNGWLVNIYMAICLSIYPMTALVFLVVKCFSNDYEGGKKALIYNVFFYGWLAISTFFIIKRDNYFTNKASLLLGSILGFLVPISNGIVSGNWPWVTWEKGYTQIFVMDVFWILLSITALAVVFKLKPKEK